MTGNRLADAFLAVVKAVENLSPDERERVINSINALYPAGNSIDRDTPKLGKVGPGLEI